jgi:hypothetical protein
MGKLLGVLLFLIGLGLLTLALCVPPVLLSQSTWTVIWRAGLGFVLCVAGYLMADYAGGNTSLKFMAFLLALLGLGLLALAIFPPLFSVSLYGRGGNTWRIVLGVILCIGGYGLWELGNTGLREDTWSEL